MSESNGRVSTRDFIEAQISALREHQDTKFDALEKTFERHCEESTKQRDDHETRIRSLEKRITWSNVAQGIGNLFAIILGVFGFDR